MTLAPRTRRCTVAKLAEFASVVDAVQCAVEIQEGVAARSVDAPEHERIELRIGINLGDVMVEADDLYGDGVNVAARLESLAEPGGICVSESVRTAAGSKLALGFEFMGEREVKNIAQPVRTYRVVSPDEADGSLAAAGSQSGAGSLNPGKPRLARAAAALVLPPQSAWYTALMASPP